jgi:inhibitor of cysteine peptidase
MRVFRVIFLLFFVGVIHASTDPNVEIIVSPSDPEFTITVPANPTTGFSWRVKEMNTELFEKISKKFQKKQTRLIGSGGHTEFTFKLKKLADYPASSRIILYYSQPWEPKKGKIKIFTVTIKQ